MANIDILHDIRIYDDTGREILIQRLNFFTWEISHDENTNGFDILGRNFRSVPFVFENHLNGYVTTVPDGSSYNIHIDENGYFKIKSDYLKTSFENDYITYKGATTKTVKSFVEYIFNQYIQSAKLNLLVYNPHTNSYYDLNSLYKGLADNIKHLLRFDIKEQSFYIDDEENPDYFEYYVSGVRVTDATSLRDCINAYFYDYGNNSLCNIIGSQGSLYPLYTLMGSYETEPVSVELISSNSLFILTDDDKRPHITGADVAFLTANIPDNGELGFITTDKKTSDVKLTNSIITDLTKQADYNEPVVLPIGFITDTEGCYQNDIELFFTGKNRAGEIGSYHIGTIYIKSKAIGEDERYRTLFDNFGLPDPIEYAKIFKESDVDEQGNDFELINRKSKELFLTYDKIFPYVGTYKALINAVRFLGYDDVFFKEWYKIINDDGKDKTIAFDSIDPKSPVSLQSKLKRHGITYDEFLKYKKLNRLSLVYRLNIEDDDHEHIKAYTYNGANKHVYDMCIQNPTTRELYDYSDKSLLAKLYYLKQWLEKYVIGVNCRIQDVTGEGIYFHRFKSQAYANTYQTHRLDFDTHITPYPVDKNLQMRKSEAFIKCSLYEFDSLKFGDFGTHTFGDYVDVVVDMSDNKRVSKNDYAPSYTTVERYMPVSSPIEASLDFDEISYDVETLSGNGTLHEVQKGVSANNPIYVHDNELYIYGDGVESIIDQGKQPVIQLNHANIRKPYGNWNSNIVYTIKPMNNPVTGDLVYIVGIVGDADDKISISRPLLLKPKNNAVFKYTERNKWGVPLLIFSNYEVSVDDVNIGLADDVEYVLEILDGKLLFDSIDYMPVDLSGDEVGTRMQMEVGFGYNYNTKTNLNEQTVSLSYNYHGQRKRVYNFKSNMSTADINTVKNTAAGELLYFTTNKSSRKSAYYSEYIRYVWTKYNLPKMIDPLFCGIKSINGSNLTYYQKGTVGTGNNKRETVNTTTITIPASLQDNRNRFTGITSVDSDFVKWLFSEEAASSYVDTRLAMEETDINSRMYSNFEKLYRNRGGYKINREHKIKVNHIGDYSITAKGYDCYNNIYIKKANTVANVDGIAPDIILYTNSATSRNSKDFYPHNINGVPQYKTITVNGKKVDVNNTDDIVSEIDSTPAFPKAYRIFDMSANGTSMSYDSISYVYDTPKHGDIITLNNLSERCTGITKSGLQYKISILDENPRDVDVFTPGLFVNIVVYDNRRLCVDNVYGPFVISSSGIVDSDIDENYADDSYINISLNLATQRSITSAFNNTDYTVFVTNATAYKAIVYEINPDVVYVYDSKFKIGDVIKVLYDYKNQDNNTDNEFESYDPYIAETTYRIINVDKSDDGAQILTLDGYVNTGVNIRVSYANIYPVDYKVKVTTDGQEAEVNIGRNGYNDVKTIRTTFDFDNRSWFAGNYVDDTYTGYITDYEPMNLINDWISNPDMAKDLYAYTNHPVTLDKGQCIIAKHNDANNTTDGNYIVVWNWYVNTVEKIKTRLYKAINDVISVNALYAGVNDVELKSVDRYGNEFINKRDGLIRCTI